MRNIIIILLIGLFFTSCITERKCAKKYPPQIITEKVIEYRDSLIPVYIYDTTFIAADTVFDTTEVHINNGIVWSDRIFADTEFSSAWAQVVNSRLLLELTQKDTAIAKLLRENVRVEIKTVKEVKTRVVKEFVVAWYDKVARSIAIIFILAILVLIATKVIKAYVKPF